MKVDPRTPAVKDTPGYARPAPARRSAARPARSQWHGACSSHKGAAVFITAVSSAELRARTVGR